MPEISFDRVWHAATDQEKVVITWAAIRAGVLWVCEGCRWHNKEGDKVCESCGLRRPG